MGQISVEKNVNGIEGLCVITPAVHGDSRGYFMETYSLRDMEEAGFHITFVQDSQSMSTKGVLRGLHFQKQYPQTKLVRVNKGIVFDVAVDLRVGSATYGQWHGEILSADNKKQYLIPRGFAHGFLVLSDTAEFNYKSDDFYHPNDEGGIAWNDPEIGIEWPMLEGEYKGTASAEGYTVDGVPLHLSDKDQKWLGIRGTGYAKEEGKEIMADYKFKWKNDGRLKIMIGCGTRPEIIRLAAVMKRCREYFDTCIVYYNQNWDPNLSTVFWQDFKLENTFGEYGPDILVPVVGDNLGVTCGNILGRSYELLSDLHPDGYLVLGDTNSCLSAISAKRLHIPLFHMEAGNRCKDECLPEETNRRIVDVISDVNLCYSEFARKYLADTGLPKERTYMTGSPMAEVLRMNLEKIEASDVLDRLGLEPDRYILLSAHREENIDTEKNFTSLFTAINALAEKYDMPILYSCHPRSKKRLEATGFKLDLRVRVNEPLGFNDYNKLQMNALAIVSDSGTLPEESSFYLSIGHPIAAVCIRTSTERPEALESGNFILAGITTNELLNATSMAIEMKQKGVLGKPCPDYVDENVSMKVVRIIQGYVNVVNKMVWRKDV